MTTHRLVPVSRPMGIPSRFDRTFWRCVNCGRRWAGLPPPGDECEKAD